MNSATYADAIESKLDSIVPYSTQKIELVAHQFQSNFYIYYKIDGCYYSDIDHILSNVTTDSESYERLSKEFGKDVVCSVRTHGVLRNLIDQQTVGRIVLATDCQYSRVYKVESLMTYLTIYTLLYGALVIYVISGRGGFV